jgi:hypothetical protein
MDEDNKSIGKLSGIFAKSSKTKRKKKEEKHVVLYRKVMELDKTV